MGFFRRAPVATLPGAWRYRVSAGTGWPGVGILLLGEEWSLIYNFHLSVAERATAWADPSLGYTSMLHRTLSNQQTTTTTPTSEVTCFSLVTCFVYVLDTPPCWFSGKAFPSRVADLGSIPTFASIFHQVESYPWLKHWHSSDYPARNLGVYSIRRPSFTRSSHTRDLNIVTLVTTLPGTWGSIGSVNAGTGLPGVSICDWVKEQFW